MDGCPPPALVARALARVWPEVPVTFDPREGAAPVEIADLGVSFRVRVAGSERVFTDWNRACEERAKTAAVYVAIALRPLAAPPPASRPAPPPSPPVPRAPPAPPTPHRTLRFEAAAVADTAPGVDGTPTAGGAQVGASLEGRLLGGTASLEALAPATLSFPAGRVQLSRAALALSLRAVVHVKRLDIAGEVGAAPSLLVLRGLGPATPATTLRFDAPALAALLVRLRVGRVEPFLALHAELSLHPYDLAVAPAGNVGRTPRLWLGADAGIAVPLQ